MKEWLTAMTEQAAVIINAMALPMIAFGSWDDTKGAML
jgi:hypothetical protein